MNDDLLGFFVYMQEMEDKYKINQDNTEIVNINKNSDYEEKIEGKKLIRKIKDNNRKNL